MAMEILNMALVGINAKPLTELLSQGFSVFSTPDFTDKVCGGLLRGQSRGVTEDEEARKRMQNPRVLAFLPVEQVDSELTPVLFPRSQKEYLNKCYSYGKYALKIKRTDDLDEEAVLELFRENHAALDYAMANGEKVIVVKNPREMEKVPEKFKKSGCTVSVRDVAPT